MRLPRTVQITGKKFTISRDPKTRSSKGSMRKQHIVLGTAGKDDDIWDAFVHEVTELVAVERGLRFNHDFEDGLFLYIINHRDFQNFATDVAAALWPLIQKGKNARRNRKNSTLR